MISTPEATTRLSDFLRRELKRIPTTINLGGLKKVRLSYSIFPPNSYSLVWYTDNSKYNFISRSSFIDHLCVHQKVIRRKITMNDKVQHIISLLEHRAEPQALSPVKVWNPVLGLEISALKLTTSHPNHTAIALMAGLHLWNDNLDASHSYAQQIED